MRARPHAIANVGEPRQTGKCGAHQAHRRGPARRRRASTHPMSNQGSILELRSTLETCGDHDNTRPGGEATASNTPPSLTHQTARSAYGGAQPQHTITGQQPTPTPKPERGTYI